MKQEPKKRLILMADDDADDRLLAKDALEESGCDVEMRFVENGAQLMDYLHRKPPFNDPAQSPIPGLVILDLNMPKKDGREALSEIKSHPTLKRIPVVILTTSKADTDIARIYELGANSFISKPTAFDALVGTMKCLADYWFKVVVSPN